MAFVNETIAVTLAIILAGTLVVGSAVSIKKPEEQEAAAKDVVKDNKKPLPPPPAPPPPPPSMIEPEPVSERVKRISAEIKSASPELPASEVLEAVEKADRLDRVEQRIDEVVVEQRVLNDRIENILESKGSKK